MALESLQELYIEQLRDLYSAEQQIIEALPKMIKAAKHTELRQGFELHLNQTKEHRRRLEQIGQRSSLKLEGHHCKGMEGLLEEGEEILKQRADSDVLDAALIAAAQRVEHYEMAGYGCARTYARLLGLEDDAKLLQRTLDEEGKTDHQLTALAEQVINVAAMVGSDREAKRSVGAEGSTQSSRSPRAGRGDSEASI